MLLNLTIIFYLLGCLAAFISLIYGNKKSNITVKESINKEFVFWIFFILCSWLTVNAVIWFMFSKRD